MARLAVARLVARLAVARLSVARLADVMVIHVNKHPGDVKVHISIHIKVFLWLVSYNYSCASLAC